MSTQLLTEHQIKQFKDDGYVALPDFFTKEEVTAMLAELERFKSEGLGRNVATEGDGETTSTTKINYQIIPLNNKSTLFRAMPFHPKIIDCLSHLIGTPFVRQLDQIFLKPAHTGAGTDWHTDNGYFKISDPTKATGMWIALHDATIANGTLEVVPGSYKQTFDHERDLNSDHHIHTEVEDSAAVAVELPAGGAVFFNYGTAHGTRANNTDHERAGLAFHFLRTDYIPADYGEGSLASFVHLTGAQATGGEAEYGERVEGTWADEVAALLAD
ncbi:MAG: phytanoyl-CoA dioxygenase family protein [Chloroflexota bacterium]